MSETFSNSPFLVNSGISLIADVDNPKLPIITTRPWKIKSEANIPRWNLSICLQRYPTNTVEVHSMVILAVRFTKLFLTSCFFRISFNIVSNRSGPWHYFKHIKNVTGKKSKKIGLKIPHFWGVLKAVFFQTVGFLKVWTSIISRASKTFEKPISLKNRRSWKYVNWLKSMPNFIMSLPFRFNRSRYRCLFGNQL